MADPRVQALEAWVRCHGGRISDDIVIHEGARDAKGRGALAAADGLKADSEVCCIPEELLITERTAEAALPFGEDLRTAGEQLAPGASGLLLLAAFLLQDSAMQAAQRAASGSDGGGGQTSSFYREYYQVLTLDLQHLPAFWPADHQLLQGQLKGSRLERLVKAKRHSLGLEFALLQSCAAHLFSVTWEEFLWARCTVASRAYALQLGPGADAPTRCLVPWADLLNHGGSGQVGVRYLFEETAEPEKRGSFVMRCVGSGVQGGEEVYQSYGVGKQNAALLLDYGFTLPSLAAPAVASLSVRPPAFEGDSPDKRAACRSLWQAAGGRPASGPMTLEVSVNNGQQLLQLLRVSPLCASVTTAEEIQRLSQHLAKPHDHEVERRALLTLKELVSSAIAHHPCKLEGMAPRAEWEAAAARACARVLEEEQQVLHFYAELADHGLACLDLAASSTHECNLPCGAQAWLSTLGLVEQEQARAYLSALAEAGWSSIDA